MVACQSGIVPGSAVPATVAASEWGGVAPTQLAPESAPRRAPMDPTAATCSTDRSDRSHGPFGLSIALRPFSKPAETVPTCSGVSVRARRCSRYGSRQEYVIAHAEYQRRSSELANGELWAWVSGDRREAAGASRRAPSSAAVGPNRDGIDGGCRVRRCRGAHPAGAAALAATRSPAPAP